MTYKPTVAEGTEHFVHASAIDVLRPLAYRSIDAHQYKTHLFAAIHPDDWRVQKFINMVGWGEDRHGFGVIYTRQGSIHEIEGWLLYDLYESRLCTSISEPLTRGWARAVTSRAATTKGQDDLLDSLTYMAYRSKSEYDQMSAPEVSLIGKPFTQIERDECLVGTHVFCQVFEDLVDWDVFSKALRLFGSDLFASSLYGNGEHTLMAAAGWRLLQDLNIEQGTSDYQEHDRIKRLGLDWNPAEHSLADAIGTLMLDGAPGGKLSPRHGVAERIIKCNGEMEMNILSTYGIDGWRASIKYGVDTDLLDIIS